jgi:aspartate/tyrosine/aromatic aminotransferase
MFESIATAPPDPILGLTEAFNQDTRPEKINLSVGVYKDKSGKTPVLACVKEAEKRLLESEQSKGYKPIDGDPEYGRLVRELLFGGESDLVAGGRARTTHAPGGTGALRVVGDFLAKLSPSATLWLSDPTWANHGKIFESAGVKQATYSYFDSASNSLDFGGMLNGLSKVARGDVVLLHACCHNPTGVDPNPEQWTKIAEVLRERGAVPLLDFAYQGFASGLEQDAAGVRLLAERLEELFICSSFSKNFGLYNERTGALTIIAKTKQAADATQSQIKICVRTNYSNPPAHGGAIVRTILSDADLRGQWENELAEMRERIASMRQLFVSGLKAKGAPGDFSFITQQNGMFSFSGLNKRQVQRLRDEYAIYVVGSGRINVAGMTEANMDRLTQAVVDVL